MRRVLRHTQTLFGRAGLIITSALLLFSLFAMVINILLILRPGNSSVVYGSHERTDTRHPVAYSASYAVGSPLPPR